MPFFEGTRARLRHFVRNLLRRDRVERELTDEIDGYVDLLIEEKVAQGMSRDDARRAAWLEIGRVDLVKEHVRDVRVGAWLDALRQDVRFGVRTLMRRPGFAIVAVLTLGVGMGATTAIFSLIDSVLLKPLPFHEPDRLTMVWEVRPRFNRPRIEVAPLNYVDWQQQVQAFESLAAYVNGFVNLTGAGTPERLAVAQVTPNLFPTLGVDPLVGRWFVTPEGSPGTDRRRDPELWAVAAPLRRRSPPSSGRRFASMASLTWSSVSCLAASSFPARVSRSGRPSIFARAGVFGRAARSSCTSSVV